jgi:hypothetical protein
LHEKVDKRDDYIERLRNEVFRLRMGANEEVRGGEGEDLLEMDMLDGEEEYDGADDEDGDDGELEGGEDEEEGDEMDEMELDEDEQDQDYGVGRRRKSVLKAVGVGKSPALGPSHPRIKA